MNCSAGIHGMRMTACFSITVNCQSGCGGWSSSRRCRLAIPRQGFAFSILGLVTYGARKSKLRYLFKKSMLDVLPPDVIKKQNHGFGLPYCIWVGERGPLQDFTFDVLGSTRCRQRGYFRPDLFEWLWSQYESVHQKFYGDLLWVFMMLELWHLKHDEAAMARQQQEVVPLSHGVN